MNVREDQFARTRAWATKGRRAKKLISIRTAMLALVWFGLFPTGAQVVPEADRQKVEAAIPSTAIAKPRKPRKLLIFDLNVNYGGHSSIPTANLTFTLMGQKTGAFATVVSREPKVFERESLRQFDAVFFNNTVGNCFTNTDLRQNLVDFVYGGGGLMGVHGTTVGFTQWPGAKEDWPEFGLMIGARGANHRTNNEHVFIKLDDPAHPLNASFGGQGFDYRSEFFRVHDPYSRNRLRVLFSIDTVKTDLKQGQGYGKLERADNDFALAWVRNYGRGRTFYCTIAHQPSVFWDPKMLQFYLGAAQFVLGDLPAPTTPSGRLTPPLVAQEKLGWRLGLSSHTAYQHSIFEVIDFASQLGLPYVEVSNQQLFRRGEGGLVPWLSEEKRRELRFQLDAAGVRLLAYTVDHPIGIDEATSVPGSEAAWRETFDFARKLGIETIIGAPPAGSLAMLDKLCVEFDLRLALDCADATGAPEISPTEALRLCEGHTPRIGICGDFMTWARAGIAPIDAIRMLKSRLITIQLHDVQELSNKARDVEWGTGVVKLDECLKEIRQLGIQPAMFGVNFSGAGTDFRDDLSRCVRFFNKQSLQLAQEGGR